MSASVKRNRKRNSTAIMPPSGFARSLWEARNLVSSGQHEKALGALNRLASNNRNPSHRARILMLVAESEGKLSRHAEAATAFSKASRYARQASDLDLLLRSAAGEIRSLLAMSRTDQAKSAADLLVSELNKAQEQFQAVLDVTPDQLLAGAGKIDVPARPPRATVCLTKVANAFLEAGLTDEARVYLNNAIRLSPNGASRARQILAKLALASDEPVLAERYAREALQMGRFQAKTVAAWQLYLSARARLNRVPILEPDIFSAFVAHAKERIATASVLTIVRVLRAYGDDGWRGIALKAIASPEADGVIKAELEKLIHADDKLSGEGDSRTIATRALKLFRNKGVSPQEQLAHAKEYIRFSLLSGKTPKPEGIVQSASKVHGADHAFAVRHAMALGAILAGKHDLARIWLLDMLKHLEPGSEAWGKANWALARMEDDLGNHGEASVWYFEIAKSEQTPSRFRIQGMLKGFKHLAASGGSVDSPAVSESISSILLQVDDYKVALDAARQLTLAGPSFVGLKFKAAERGKQLVDAAFRRSGIPQEKLGVLEFHARRLAWDLADFDGILERWDRLTTEEKSEFARTGGSLWYEYLAVVFQAMVTKKREEHAKILVANIIDGDKSSPEGYVIVGSEYADWLMKTGDKKAAFGYFEWIATEAPTHRKSAVAHYWLSIRSLKEKSEAAAFQSASAVRKCYGGRPSLLREWELDSAALMILNPVDIAAALASANVPYSRDFLSNASARVARHVKEL